MLHMYCTEHSEMRNTNYSHVEISTFISNELILKT